jgi:DNA-directed RNA polymerase specialized sigma24 family protein
LVTGDLRGRFLGLARAYAQHLYDYAQELLGDPAASAAAVQAALTAAATHFDGPQSGAAQSGAAQPDQAPSGEGLRPWLYAATRRECRTRRPARGPAAAGDPDQEVRPGPDADPSAPASSGPGSSGPGSPWTREVVAEALTAEFTVTDLAAEERRRQTAAVTQVLSGLPDTTREVLSLTFRHGLGDDDLGVVLGISPRRAREERSEACARFDRLAATVLLLHAGWSGCRKLDRIVGGSYPTSPPPADRRCLQVARHSSSCEICGRIVASRGFGPELLSVLPIGELPAAVKQALTRVARGLVGPAGSGAARTDTRAPARTDLFRPAAARTDVISSGPARAGRADPGPGHASARPARTDLAGISSAGPGPVTPSPAIPSSFSTSAVSTSAVSTSAVSTSPATPSPFSTSSAGAGPAGTGVAAPGPAGQDTGSTVRVGAGLAGAGRGSGDMGTPGLPGDGGPGSRPHAWLTRPRAAVASAVAMIVIVAGLVLAGRLASAPAGHSTKSATVTSSKSPTSQPSGTAPSSTGPARRPARTRPSKAASTAPPLTPYPSYYPTSSGSPTPSPTPKPSSTKPTPKPSKTTTPPSPTPTPTLTTPPVPPPA